VSIVEYYPTDTPYGLTYGQWTVKWWQWALSIPDSISPVGDDNGTFAAVNQPENNVWFLAGTWATERVSSVPLRKVVIPFGRSILFPVINCEANPIEYPNLKTDEDIVNQVAKDEDTIVTKQAVLNNNLLRPYRVKSDPVIFPLNMIPITNNNQIVETKASADGYWVFLKSLSVGKYDLRFGGSCEKGRLNTEVNYKMTIK
jgi:hypothetical protein